MSRLRLTGLLAVAAASVSAQAMAAGETAGALGAMNQRSFTGAWHRPAAGGQGIQLEIYPDAVAPGVALVQGGWVTYSLRGFWDYEDTLGPRWYTFRGALPAGQTTAALTIYANVGGNFDAPPVTNPTPEGTGKLTLDDCTSITFDYALPRVGFMGTIPLERLLPDVGCSESSLAVSDGDFALSGNWFDPEMAGQGVWVEVNPRARQVFLVWYTYAPRGEGRGYDGQRWYVGVGGYPTSGGRDFALTFYETTDGLFDSDGTPVINRVGTGALSLADCAATLAFDFRAKTNAGRFGSIALSRVGGAPAECRH